MPPEIDRAARLDAIARATLDVATEQGVDAVTIRSVAAQMGGSTTLVTKFVPTRGSLLSNVIRFVEEEWRDERQRKVDTKHGVDRLRSLVALRSRTNAHEMVVTRLWLQTLASEDDGGLAQSRQLGRADHDRLRAASAGADLDVWIADLMYLALRGYYVSLVEDPRRWTSAKVRATLECLIQLDQRDRPGD